MPTPTEHDTIETAQVTGRREVHYDSFDQLLAEVDALAAGGYEALGNWSLGRTTAHLARAMQAGLDGAPMAPLHIRVVAKMFFKAKLLRGMTPGFKLPQHVAAKTVAQVETSDEEGIAELRQTCDRWQREPQRHPHSLVGRLTSDEWDRLMLRHAELHMGFLLPKSG
jgi:hypothetical protein